MTLITNLIIFFLTLLINTNSGTPMKNVPFPEAVKVYGKSKREFMVDRRHEYLNGRNEFVPKSLMTIFKYRLQNKRFKLRDSPICPTESFIKGVLPRNRSTSRSATRYSSVPTSTDLQSFDLYHSMPCLSPTTSTYCERYNCLADEDSKTLCKKDYRKPRTLRGFSVHYCVGKKICNLVEDGELNSTRIQHDTECAWLKLIINCFFVKIRISSVVNHLTLTKVSQLHLKKCGIYEVNQMRYLPGIKWFKYLNISYNGIEELPSNLFSNLINLVNLDISSNKLLSLPSNIFFHQTSVEILNLASNKLSILPTEIFSKLFALKELNLSGNNLVILPEIIFHNLNSLMILDLSCNSLSTLPHNILNQSNALWMLDLSSNQISTLPGNIFKHNTNLWTLYLSSNELVSVPDDIFNRNFDLVMLDLSSNQISTLPGNIFKHNTNLWALDLSSNELVSVPADVFNRNFDLVMLDLSSNRLSSLPDNILKHCPWLLACNFSSNRLLFLPNDVFKYNTAIELLDLSTNMFKSLPGDLFRYNAAVEILDISTNIFVSLPDNIFANNTAIKILDISTNMLSSLPEDIFKYDTAIEVLDLSTNTLSCLPHKIFKYNTAFNILDLSTNMFTSLPYNIFKYNTMIRTLNLSTNRLSSLPDDIFKHNTAIWSLDLSTNRLSSLPDDIFKHNTAIWSLDLSTNRLSSLPDDIFKHNTAIWSLDLSTNRLSSLPDDIFKHNTAIKSLDLSTNILSYLPDDMFKYIDIYSIFDLDLSSNMFSTLPYNIFKYNIKFSTLDLSSNFLSSLPNDSFEIVFDAITLDLSANNLSFLPDDIFIRSRFLRVTDLSFNILSDLPDALFMNNRYLTALNLSSNKLSILPDNIFQYNTKLSILDLSSNMLSVPCNIGTLPSLVYLNLSENIISRISKGDFRGLQSLKILDLSLNHLHYIESSSFANLANLNELILIKNDILIREGIFKGLNNLETLFVDSYQICCVQPTSTKRTNGCIVFKDTHSVMQCVNHYEPVSSFMFFYTENIRKIKRSKPCSYTKDAISDCWNLIRLEVLRVFLWTIGTIALLGNVLVLLYRLAVDRENIWSSYSLFVLNLSVSDFLMGIYMLIVASADNDFKGNYVYYEQDWKKSILCSSAGILCTISSEMSTFLILAITTDRFIVIVYPLSQRKITWKQAACVSVMCWILSTLLGIIPQFSFESYFKGEFYSKSGVCIALPLTSENGSGLEYSVAVFIVLNSIIFLAVLAASVWMYRSMRSSGKITSNQTRKRDIAVAKTLFYVVATDFCCWIPVGVMGAMAQLGGHVPDDVYAWVIVFVLPINSAINPFLYTFSYIWRKRKRMQAKQRYNQNPPQIRKRPENMETTV